MPIPTDIAEREYRRAHGLPLYDDDDPSDESCDEADEADFRRRALAWFMRGVR